MVSILISHVIIILLHYSALQGLRMLHLFSVQRWRRTGKREEIIFFFPSYIFIHFFNMIQKIKFHEGISTSCIGNYYKWKWLDHQFVSGKIKDIFTPIQWWWKWKRNPKEKQAMYYLNILFIFFWVYHIYGLCFWKTLKNGLRSSENPLKKSAIKKWHVQWII